MNKYLLPMMRYLALLLPSFLRRNQVVAWLWALGRPLDDIHVDFTATRTRLDVEAVITGQVLVMEWRLNNLFDAGLRRIVIVDGSPRRLLDAYKTREAQAPLIAYKANQNQPRLATYKSREYAASAGNTDFIVRVPTSLMGSQMQLRRIVDLYRLATKTYVIVPNA